MRTTCSPRSVRLGPSQRRVHLRRCKAMFAWLRSLFGLGPRKTDAGPIDEDAAYANSYGHRTGEILYVEPIPEPEPEPKGDLTGEFLRRAFEKKLEARKKLTN